MNLRNLFSTARTLDYSFSIGADGEVDYNGTSVAKAMEALDACDELDVTFFERRLGKDYRIGSIYFVRNEDDVSDLGNVCDAGGWANDWLDENAY